MPGTLVVTVFAGGGGVDWNVWRWWDHDCCGIPIGSDVVQTRIAEDEAALGRLRAYGHRLEFLDLPYRSTAPETEHIGAAIARAIADHQIHTVVFPLGLFHRDHKFAAAGAAWTSRRSPGVAFFAYKDLPYANQEGGPSEIEAALSRLSDLTPREVGPLYGARHLEDKAAAMDLYATQMRGLGPARRLLALEPEGFWSLHPASRTLFQEPVAAP